VTDPRSSLARQSRAAQTTLIVRLAFVSFESFVVIFFLE
jgi:hypothetical protein